MACLKVAVILSSLLVCVAGTGHDRCMVNVVILADRSGSLDRDRPFGDEDNIEKLINFLSGLVRNLDIDENDVEVGLISFANNATVKFRLGEFNAADTEERIRSLEDDFEGGRTNTQRAFELAITLFDERDRPAAQNFVVLVTDGRPTPELNSNLMNVVDELRRRHNTRIIGIGVTAQVGESLFDIVTSVENDFFNIPDFLALENVVNTISRQICPEPTPIECPAPEDGVSFSAYSMNREMVEFVEEMTVPFQRTFSNRGGHYNTNTYNFTCPCRGMYTFTHTMSGMTRGVATVIKRDGVSVSPLAYVTPDGAMSTTTIIECNEGQRVYVEVVAAPDLALMPCTYRENSLYGFTGRLDFTIP